MSMSTGSSARVVSARTEKRLTIKEGRLDASRENGKIHAEILSEHGMPLTLESPGDGYVLLMEDGRKIPVTEDILTVETRKGEKIVLLAE